MMVNRIGYRTYSIDTKAGWQPEVFNNNDYAGVPGYFVGGVAMRRVDGGSIEYRVMGAQAAGMNSKPFGWWYGWVYTGNINDPVDGWAGNYGPLNRVQIGTPDDIGLRGRIYWGNNGVGFHWGPWTYAQLDSATGKRLLTLFPEGSGASAGQGVLQAIELATSK